MTNDLTQSETNQTAVVTSGSAIGRSKSSNLNGLVCLCARIASILMTPAEVISLADVIQRPSTAPTCRDQEVVPLVHAAITISNVAN
jgi:hypothetical protein